MKFVCVFLIVSVAAVQAITLSAEQKEKVKKYHMECLQETKVNPDLIKKARKGEFVEDPLLKKFALCFFMKANLITKDGKLNEEAALSKLPHGVDKDAARKVIDACKNTKGTDPADTVFQIYKCYYNTTPTHISLM